MYNPQKVKPEDVTSCRPPPKHSKDRRTTLAKAVTKMGDELHGDKEVMMSLMLRAYPPPLAVLKTNQGLDTVVVQFCTAALTALATTGEGCTLDINVYNAGKATPGQALAHCRGILKLLRAMDLGSISLLTS